MRYIALVALTVAATAGCAFGGEDFKPRSFDPAIWRHDKDQRGAMVDDLLRRHVRLGMSRSSALRKLGAPDISGKRATKTGRVGTYDVYDVGRYKRQSADYLTLFYVRGRLYEVDPPIGVPLGDLTK